MIDLAKYISMCCRGKLTIDRVPDKIPTSHDEYQALDYNLILDPFDDETDVASDKLIVLLLHQKLLSPTTTVFLRLRYGTSAVQRDWTSRLYVVRKSQSKDSTVLPTLTVTDPFETVAAPLDTSWQQKREED